MEVISNNDSDQSFVELSNLLQSWELLSNPRLELPLIVDSLPRTRQIIDKPNFFLVMSLPKFYAREFLRGLLSSILYLI